MLLPQQLADHGLRLARGRAVAEGDVRDLIPIHEPPERFDRFGAFCFGERGVDDGGVQHLARRVNDGDLAAVAVAWVEAHGHMAAHGRLHEQRPEIQSKIADGPLVGPLRERGTQLALHAGRDEAVIGVLTGGAQEGGCAAARHEHAAAHADEGLLAVRFQRDLQKALAFTAVHGEDLVALQPGHRLAEVIIELIDGGLLLLPLRGLRAQNGLALHQAAESFAHGSIVGDGLRYDVGRTGQCVLRRLHAVRRVCESGGKRERIWQIAGLPQQLLSQRRKAALPGDGRARAALRLIGPV